MQGPKGLEPDFLGILAVELQWHKGYNGMMFPVRQASMYGSQKTCLPGYENYT